ncbi:MAG: protein FlbA-like [Moraxellaceae bacterium]|nr:protein FlbA-like [Moraxellaceae bacterium]
MSMPSTPTPPANLQKSVLVLAQARALEKAGQLQQATDAYLQAIRLYPGNPASYAALMGLLLTIGDTANAEKVLLAVPPEVYRQSTQIRSRHVRLLVRQGQYEKTLEVIDSLTSAKDIDWALLYFNQAVCHNHLGRLDVALPLYEKAHAAGMRESALYENWARVHQLLGNVDEADRLYQEVIEKFPYISSIQYEYALLMLKSGNYAKGFGLYWNRWKTGLPEFRPCEAAELGIPLWDGKSPVRSLLVGREQGIGDQLVLSALLPAMAAKAENMTVAMDPRLAPMIARSFPGLTVLDHVLTAEEARQFDAHIPAADLGLYALDGIGWTHGYLKADTGRVQALREKYQRLFPGKKLIGISWKSKRAALGEEKSVDIQDWRALLAHPECQFISLQYGDVADDLRTAREALGVEIYLDPEIDSFNDIDGLAAQVSALDLVISTSNSTAHVAAATDTPTWVLLPMGSGLLWYWGYRENECTWYPHVRLFRARKPGEWNPVLAAADQALGEMLGAG